MASDFPVDSEKLRKLIKKARSMPISFGYNDGTNDEDDEFLAAHARKDPEMLGKIAKSEGAGTKSAYGTFRVDGSEVHLTCFRSTPQLAKKFKKYLKKNKITLNVVVLDPSGAVIDSDVEQLDDWFQEQEDAADLADDAAEAVEELVEAGGTSADGAAAPAGADPEAATLAARLRMLQPKVAAAPPAIAERLMTAFKAVIALIRAGQTAQAGGTLGQIEAIIAKLAAQPTAGTAEPAGGTAPASTAADPRLPKLREAVEKLSGQVATILGDGAGPLLDELERIGGLIDTGEAEAALTALRSVQEQLKNAQAAKEKWDKAFAVLEPQVNQALSARSVASPDDLRTKWQFAVTLASEGVYERGLAALPAIVAILRAGPGDAPAKGEPPVGVVAFQRSRVLWVGTRQKMLDEARKLADAIVANSADDEDAAEIAQAAAEIMAEVEGVDTRLQDILDEITVAEERQRAALKRRAAAVVSEYQALLSQGIFPKIDQNPFAPVQVTARARAALDQIARTLA
jgi:type II secretory pathway pseudopilin PulG